MPYHHSKIKRNKYTEASVNPTAAEAGTMYDEVNRDRVNTEFNFCIHEFKLGNMKCSLYGYLLIYIIIQGQRV